MKLVNSHYEDIQFILLRTSRSAAQILASSLRVPLWTSPVSMLHRFPQRTNGIYLRSCSLLAFIVSSWAL